MAPTRSSRRHTITKSTRAGPVSARDTGTGTGTGTGTDTGKGYSPSPGPGSGLGSGTGTRTGTRQATRLRVRTPGNIDGDTPSARKVGVVDTNAVHTKTSNCGGSDLDRQLPTDSIVDMDMDVDMDMTVDIDAEVDVDVKPVLSPSPSPPASLPLVTSSPRTIPLVPLPPRLPLELQISQSQPVLQPKLEPLSPAPVSAPTSSAEPSHPSPPRPTRPAQKQLAPPPPPAPPAPTAQPAQLHTPAQPRFAPRTSDDTRQCTNCGELDTPQWRGTLCNACALWKRARGTDRPLPLLFPRRRGVTSSPTASPTPSPSRLASISLSPSLPSSPSTPPPPHPSSLPNQSGYDSSRRAPDTVRRRRIGNAQKGQGALTPGRSEGHAQQLPFFWRRGVSRGPAPASAQPRASPTDARLIHHYHPPHADPSHTHSRPHLHFQAHWQAGDHPRAFWDPAFLALPPNRKLAHAHTVPLPAVYAASHHGHHGHPYAFHHTHSHGSHDVRVPHASSRPNATATTPAEASAAKSTRENELRSSSPSPSPSPSCSSLDHNNTASPRGQGQGQGQGQGYPGFQTTATACDTPSKDEFVRVAGWLWGVLDRTERLLREMDAMEERGGLASDLGVGVGTD